MDIAHCEKVSALSMFTNRGNPNKQLHASHLSDEIKQATIHPQPAQLIRRNKTLSATNEALFN